MHNRRDSRGSQSQSRLTSHRAHLTSHILLRRPRTCSLRRSNYKARVFHCALLPSPSSSLSPCMLTVYSLSYDGPVILNYSSDRILTFVVRFVTVVDDDGQRWRFLPSRGLIMNSATPRVPSSEVTSQYGQSSGTRSHPQGRR